MNITLHDTLNSTLNFRFLVALVVPFMMTRPTMAVLDDEIIPIR